jgi:hypothetical protein
MSMNQTLHRSGHGNRLVAKRAQVLDHFAIGPKVHVSSRVLWRSFAEVEKCCLAAGHARQHEAAAAQVAGLWVDNSKSESSRHRGIYEVAPFLKRRETRSGSVIMSAYNHGVLCAFWTNPSARIGV